MPFHPARYTLLRALPCLAMAFCAVPATAAAQQPDTARAPLRVRGDTVAAAQDSAQGISPRGAFIRSLVLPGWGQSELGEPGRGGIYFALEAGSLWMLIKSDRKLDQARELERVARETGQLRPNQPHPLVRDRRNQREDWLTLSIFWLFFSGADAFVAAHLKDFDVRVNAIPRPDGAVQMQATIPLGGP